MSVNTDSPSDFEKNLLDWCKLFLADRLASLSKSRVKYGFSEENISNSILSSATIGELAENANAATRYGMKAMGTNIAPIKAFYDFTLLYFSKGENVASISNVNKPLFDDFMDDPSMKARSLGTQQNYSSTIVSFSKFVEKKTGGAVNFGFRHNTARFKKDTDKHKIPDHLSPIEFQKFLDFLCEKSINGARDLLLALLFSLSGAKTEEIAELRVSDILIPQENEHLIYLYLNRSLKDNNASKRRVPIPREKIEPVLNQFITKNRLDEDDFLFQTPTGKLKQQMISSIISSLLSEAGIHKKGTPRLLRHSYAVYLLSKGLPLKNLQELLGLENITMVAIYAECVRNDNDAGFERYFKAENE